MTELSIDMDIDDEEAFIAQMANSAMQTILNGINPYTLSSERAEVRKSYLNIVAELSYEVAEAMLVEHKARFYNE